MSALESLMSKLSRAHHGMPQDPMTLKKTHKSKLSRDLVVAAKVSTSHWRLVKIIPMRQSSTVSFVYRQQGFIIHRCAYNMKKVALDI